LSVYQDSSQRTVPDAPPPEPSHAALFEGVPRDDVKLILSHAAVGNYSTRSWLYHAGEPATELFLVHSGIVRLSQLAPEGRDVLERFVTPGGMFGFYSLSPGVLNVVSAQVIRPSRLVVWDQNIALHLLHTTPRLALNLFNLAMHDIAFLNDRTRRLVADSVERRVQWALAELVRTIGVCTSQGVGMVLDIGHRELADLAGTTIFTVSRRLNWLERQGVLKTGRGHIMVLQPEKILENMPKTPSVVATRGSLPLNC
jgi:CRP-like cAMP-binding protein